MIGIALFYQDSFSYIQNVIINLGIGIWVEMGFSRHKRKSGKSEKRTKPWIIKNQISAETCYPNQ